jgi:transcriptional regulator with XRE-family HTH domain
MVRRRRQEAEGVGGEVGDGGVGGDAGGEAGVGESGGADLNEIVAYNFKRAREMYGWTQDDVADRLERFLGVRLPQASISGIERGYQGRHREFDAQEILAFACCFDVPLIWFFIPPAGDTRRLRNTSDHVNELYALLLGREDQLGLLYERFRELGIEEPTDADHAWGRLTSGRTQRTMWDYRTRRKDLLIALLEQYSDDFDKSIDELGTVVDRLRQVGLKGFVSSTMNDPDYGLPPEHRGKVHLDTLAEVERLLVEERAQIRAQAEKERNEDKSGGGRQRR